MEEEDLCSICFSEKNEILMKNVTINFARIVFKLILKKK
jgi:hypothetical protein